MMKQSLLATAALGLGLALTSCGKPKELELKQLKYESQGTAGFFKDPETNQGFTGVAKQYSKDGKLISAFPMKNGHFHGTLQEWYPNGKPKSEVEFVKGARHGKCTEWTETGLVYVKRVYDDDRIVSEVLGETGK